MSYIRVIHTYVVGSQVDVVMLSDQIATLQVQMVRVARFSYGFSTQWQGIWQGRRTRTLLCTFMLFYVSFQGRKFLQFCAVNE